MQLSCGQVPTDNCVDGGKGEAGNPLSVSTAEAQMAAQFPAHVRRETLVALH